VPWEHVRDTVPSSMLAALRRPGSTVQLPLWSVIVVLAAAHYLLWVYRKSGELLEPAAPLDVPQPAAKIPRSWEAGEA